MQQIAFAPADPKAALTQIPHAAAVYALYGAEAHQEKNAAYFASKQAALALAPNVCATIFKDTILRLLADRDRQRVLSGKILDLFPPDAAAKLAKMIIETVKKRS